MNNMEKEQQSEKYTDWEAPKTGGSSIENISNGIESLLIVKNVPIDKKEIISSIYEGLKDKDKKEFASLLPGYLEFNKSEEGLDGIERPLIHGTGSYSAKRIIKEGFRPRKLSEIITGEKSLLKNEDKDNVIPISFCDPTFENGVDISHYYATQVSSKEKLDRDLSINSENYLDNKTSQLLEYVYGGFDKVIDDYVKAREQKVKEKMDDEYKKPTDEQREKSKDIAREIILNKLRILEADDAYVYNPEKDKKTIEKLKILLDPNKKINSDEARKLFLEAGILNGEIDFQNLPYYEVDRIVKGLIDSTHTEGSYMNEKIKNSIKNRLKIKDNISKLDTQDIDEIKNQFPVYFLLEGEGKDLIEFKDVTKAREYRCDQLVENSKIRQIQVPKKFIPEVKKWLREAGLDENIVIPFEYYEMDQIIKNKNNYEK